MNTLNVQLKQSIKTHKANLPILWLYFPQKRDHKWWIQQKKQL